MNSIVKFLALVFIIIGCSETNSNPDRFKKGVFKIPAGENYSETIITRIDSLQIEEYFKKVTVSTDSSVVEKQIKHIDTLYIKWLNNFSYSLRMKNPKTKLDKDIIFVQINRVRDSSCDFTTKIGYSEFKQKGTLYIVK